MNVKKLLKRKKTKTTTKKKTIKSVAKKKIAKPVVKEKVKNVPMKEVFVLNKSNNSTLVFFDKKNKKKDKPVKLPEDKINSYNILPSRIVKVPKVVADRAMKLNKEIELVI